MLQKRSPLLFRKVQGVFYRQSTKRKALVLGIKENMNLRMANVADHCYRNRGAIEFTD